MHAILARSTARRLLPAGLAAAALLVAGAAATAQDANLLGLYYDSSATVDEIEISPNTQHVLYLVLHNPVNESFDGGGRRDVALVSGFECGLLPPSGDYLLGVEFPQLALNMGSTDNIIAGFADGVPVAGGSRTALLASLSVLSSGNNPTGWRLSPATPASLPGGVGYGDAEDPEDNLVDMLPVGGRFDQAVFWFGDWHVEEARQWGEVKALFR